jgi:hypothetical protein
MEDKLDISSEKNSNFMEEEVGSEFFLGRKNK